MLAVIFVPKFGGVIMIRKIKTQGLRVAIYARRTVDSEKSDSIQMQIDVCKKHLEVARPG